MQHHVPTRRPCTTPCRRHALITLAVALGLPLAPEAAPAQDTTPGHEAQSGDWSTVDQALQGNGIEVTALHSHMLDEQPRLFFMHFWANDDAMKLARGLRAALDRTNSARGER